MCELKGFGKALDAVLWGIMETVDVEAELGSIFVDFALGVVVGIKQRAELFEEFEQGLFGSLLLVLLFFEGGLELEFVVQPRCEVVVGGKQSNIQEEGVAFFKGRAVAVGANLLSCVLEEEQGVAHPCFSCEQEDVGCVDAFIFEEVVEFFGVVAFDEQGFLFTQAAACKDLAEACARAFFEKQEVDAFEGTAFLHLA